MKNIKTLILFFLSFSAMADFDMNVSLSSLDVRASDPANAVVLMEEALISKGYFLTQEGHGQYHFRLDIYQNSFGKFTGHLVRIPFSDTTSIEASGDDYQEVIDQFKHQLAFCPGLIKPTPAPIPLEQRLNEISTATNPLEGGCHL